MVSVFFRGVSVYCGHKEYFIINYSVCLCISVRKTGSNSLLDLKHSQRTDNIGRKVRHSFLIADVTLQAKQVFKNSLQLS